MMVDTVLCYLDTRKMLVLNQKYAFQTKICLTNANFKTFGHGLILINSYIFLISLTQTNQSLQTNRVSLLLKHHVIWGNWVNTTHM